MEPFFLFGYEGAFDQETKKFQKAQKLNPRSSRNQKIPKPPKVIL
jgi:hypothetical protein